MNALVYDIDASVMRAGVAADTRQLNLAIQHARSVAENVDRIIWLTDEPSRTDEFDKAIGYRSPFVRKSAVTNEDGSVNMTKLAELLAFHKVTMLSDTVASFVDEAAVA